MHRVTLSDEECEPVREAYQEHLESLVPSLPEPVQDLVQTINFHDGLFREVVLTHRRQRSPLSSVTEAFRSGTLTWIFFTRVWNLHRLTSVLLERPLETHRLRPFTMRLIEMDQTDTFIESFSGLNMRFRLNFRRLATTARHAVTATFPLEGGSF